MYKEIVVLSILLSILLTGCHTPTLKQPSREETQSEWKFFAEATYYDFYVDMNSIRKFNSMNTHFITYTMLTNGEKSPVFSNKKIKSLLNIISIDCNKNRYRVVSTAAFVSSFAEGQPKFQSNQHSEESPIQKQTVTWTARNLFCDTLVFWDN